MSGLLEHGLFDCVWSICQGRVEGSVTILHTLFVSRSPSYLHILVACFGGPETARCRALLGLLEGDLLKLPASSNCAGDVLFLSKNNAQAQAHTATMLLCITATGMRPLLAAAVFTDSGPLE